MIRQLVTKDHTFGNAPSPFRHLYVRDAPDGGIWGKGKPGEPFSAKVQAGIRAALADLPPLEFVSAADADQIAKRVLAGKVDRAKKPLIITVGTIDGDGDDPQAQNAMWCGGLCAQALTYVMEKRDGEWRTARTVGPQMIA